MKLSVLTAIAVCSLALATTGCGTKDTDPHEKIDAPGYYNGPMDGHGPKGAAKSGADKGGGQPAPDSTGK